MSWLFFQEKGDRFGVKSTWTGPHFVILDRGTLQIFDVKSASDTDLHNNFSLKLSALNSSPNFLKQEADKVGFTVYFLPEEHKISERLSSCFQDIPQPRDTAVMQLEDIEDEAIQIDCREGARQLRCIHFFADSEEAKRRWFGEFLQFSVETNGSKRESIYFDIVRNFTQKWKNTSSSSVDFESKVPTSDFQYEGLLVRSQVQKLKHDHSFGRQISRVILSGQKQTDAQKRVIKQPDIGESSCKRALIKVTSNGCLIVRKTKLLVCISLLTGSSVATARVLTDDSKESVLEESEVKGDDETIYSFNVTGVSVPMTSTPYERLTPRQLRRLSIDNLLSIKLGAPTEEQRDHRASEVQKYISYIISEQQSQICTRDTPKVLAKAWLFKRGSNVVFSRWARRYFVFLSSNELIYYKTEHDGQSLGIINLNETDPKDIRVIAAPAGAPSEQMIEINIFKRNLHLCLEDQSDKALDYWLTLLQNSSKLNSIPLQKNASTEEVAMDGQSFDISTGSKVYGDEASDDSSSDEECEEGTDSGLDISCVAGDASKSDCDTAQKQRLFTRHTSEGALLKSDYKERMSKCLAPESLNTDVVKRTKWDRITGNVPIECLSLSPYSAKIIAESLVSPCPAKKTLRPRSSSHCIGSSDVNIREAIIDRGNACRSDASSVGSPYCSNIKSSQGSDRNLKGLKRRGSSLVKRLMSMKNSK